MASLAELTDYYPQSSTDLPVEPLYLPSVNTNDIKLSTGEDEPTRITVRPEPRPEPDGRSIRQKLMGEFGERYQLWPEKIIREGLSAAGKVSAGEIPRWSIDKDTGEVHTSPQMIEKAQEISALAGTGGLAGADATLGSAPFLRPALKYKDKLYKGKEGQQHMDVIPKELYPEFEQMAMSGEDISHYNFGFMNHKGQFLDREKALEYAISEGLVDAHAGQYGALTSTLMADSSKPGTAIEAMAKTASPFYSALEHNVGNISQNKMTGEQWLGTLSNKPGVKPEEMQWTGLQDFLQSKGKEPVTKEQISEHLANNKVELKEVSKADKVAIDPVVKFIYESLGPASKHITDAASIADARKFNSHFRETTKGMSDEEVLNAARASEKLEGVGDSKYHSYQLPGAKNYREMLLTLPEKKIEPKQYTIKKESEQFRVYPKDENSWVSQHPSEASAQKSIQASQFRDQMAVSSKTDYKSSHWDEPNILAHVRMNDRTIDGKKSLHMEEIQSDWHQQGRDKGYKGLSAEEKARKEALDKKPMNEWSEKDTDWYNSAVNDRSQYGVPDAPFKKSWHELALKRMIREAAEKGYDRLSWTPGEAQAARYDLSKQIEEIHYSGSNLKAYDKNGKTVIEQTGIKEADLPDYIGKEAAKKLIEQPRKGTLRSLTGQDLKIGGEGMKGFYDKMLPSAIEKIGKEHGVKVKQHELAEPYKGVGGYTFEGSKKMYDTLAEAKEASAKNLVHYIDIPQSLKDHAMHKGFPLFSKGGHMLMPVDHEPDFGDK